MFFKLCFLPYVMIEQKKDDDTALIMASEEGLLDVVSELIHLGASLDFANMVRLTIYVNKYLCMG